jgi:hypothetical protein
MSKKLSLQELIKVQNIGGVLRSRFDYSVLDETVPPELIEKLKAFHQATDELNILLDSLGAARIY